MRKPFNKNGKPHALMWKSWTRTCKYCKEYYKSDHRTGSVCPDCKIKNFREAIKLKIKINSQRRKWYAK